MADSNAAMKADPEGKIAKRLAGLKRELEELPRKYGEYPSALAAHKAWLNSVIPILTAHLKGEIDILAELAQEEKTIEALRAIKKEIAKLQLAEAELRDKLTKIREFKTLIG